MASVNPYTSFYNPDFGFIYGRPLSYNNKCDPSNRIFNQTILRNNTIVTFVPGLPKPQSDKLAEADVIIKDYAEKMRAASNNEKTLLSLTEQMNAELVSKKIDCRFLAFESAAANFIQTFQTVTNKVATSIFGLQGSMSGAFNGLGKTSMVDRGFRVWMEKSTSVTESIDNSFGESQYEQFANSAASWLRDMQFLTNTVGNGYSGGAINNTNGADAASLPNGATAASVISSLPAIAGGAKVDIPQIWKDSSFQRNYSLSFKFKSPYGDPLSVFNNVLVPFCLLLTAASPRQMGPSGMIFPYIFQIDCPGYFSSPMGVVQSISFTKGGDGSWFNTRGMPTMIEGTIQFTDLYNNFSIPMSYNQFATNLNTSAFLSNIGGLSLYKAVDPTLADGISNFGRYALASAIYPAVAATEEINAVMRYFGLTSSSGGNNRNSFGGFMGGVTDQIVNTVKGLFN